MKKLEVLILIFASFKAYSEINVREIASEVVSGVTEVSKEVASEVVDEVTDASVKAYQATAEHLPDQSVAKQETFFQKHFSFIPNSISLTPVANEYVDLNGTLTKNSFKAMNPFEAEFSIANYISITKVYRPDKYWAWRLKFSPSFSTFQWEHGSEAVIMHLTFGPKLIWHLWKRFGSLQLAAHVGPMMVDGEMNGGTESHKVITAPKLSASYYRFLWRDLFVQLQYSWTPMWQKTFKRHEETEYFNYLTSEYERLEYDSYLKSIMVVQINIGIMVFDL